MIKRRRYLAIAFGVLLVLMAGASIVGMATLGRHPLVLQGQIEATEIRISGTLPGRIERFMVEEGEHVKQGDTLVTIRSPQAEAKYHQAVAMENVAVYQNDKVDLGTRSEVVASAYQMWKRAEAASRLARTTDRRVHQLYRDSVVTLQRVDEASAAREAAEADERAAYEQYQLALAGAQRQDRESSRSLVRAAQGAVGEVSALLQDARLTAPEAGEVAAIYPTRGELVGAGVPIMDLVVLEDAHVVLNVREDLLPHFPMGSVFRGDVPAAGLHDVPFRINYICPLGSYATWRSTRQSGSFDMRTFELHGRPEQAVEGLRPGMSVLVTVAPTNR